MLVLSRLKNESIIIGDNIEVKVVDIRGDKVRLGITAPKEVQVDRVEIRAIKEKERNEDQNLRSDIDRQDIS